MVEVNEPQSYCPRLIEAINFSGLSSTIDSSPMGITFPNPSGHTHLPLLGRFPGCSTITAGWAGVNAAAKPAGGSARDR